MPDFLPPVPGDWATQAAAGTPYLLTVEDGEAAWSPSVALPLVTDDAHHAVTSESGRPVFVA